MIAFIKELSKFELNKEKRPSIIDKDLLENLKIEDKKIKNIHQNIENVSVITLEICGLGKPEKIKQIIESKKETYFHFPLGGILTKNIIFDKLEKLLNGDNGINEKSKNENKD